MRLLLLAFSTFALGGCGDVGPVAPSAPSVPAAHLGVGVSDNAPLQDVAHRIVPSLTPGPGVSALSAALGIALQHRSSASVAALEAALQRIGNDNPDIAAEVDVIRLAMAAQQ